MTTCSHPFDLSPVRQDRAGPEPQLWQFAHWQGEGGAVVGSKPQRARR